MYSLQILDSSTAAAYESMTFPLFRSHLQVLEPQGLTVAIGAADLGQPIGLALAEIQSDHHSAKVLSLYVSPERRNAGIGRALLTRLEQVLSQRGCTNVSIVYMTGKPTTSALEHLLQKCHWSTPTPRMLICKSDNRALDAPWLKIYEHLPPSFAIFPWCELTNDERIAIEKQQETNPWIPNELVPFPHEEGMEPLTSFGLRYQGQVVGWLITHRIYPDTIRYTCDWVREDLQKTGCLLALHAKAHKRQAIAKIPKAIWTVPLQHSNMVRFEEYEKDYLTSIEQTNGSFKILNASSDI
ncbi:GNAT family N-acetyltransferase [Aetokthonos hydrillicola Thurmond2011]|jgi:GNAT superfamily N-acetyltransferase|uniref:GNAT family N-acetyltransferase n=1 Tax=Aetokthonos hydrillicola Thurmond2011 TaxID=2712845 RepID=A0AAP5I7I3_9CYAN|nr:GNAT family N-acetyltransferase [Aetokthonos hydrillicola]MBO3462767.1 GNAT family N-acetyltransferase [Aetokthonos hydrillicola CCALA 1050]MBW4590658.1 GNAT family N-acetyltransferase [Aetokthonos hydrillicola CCALA 1050]MDR9895002.1 GNAT family N-acetyltransferase [Aetokthonos hydrillicola Thurmond2011]